MNDPELKLAIAACRSAYGDRDAELVKGLCGAVRWDRFLALVGRHRVQALCWQGLGSAQQKVPPDVAGKLARQAKAIVEANLRSAVESSRLLAIFQSAGIPLLFLKGLTLGALAYPDPFLKMGWDIDLLVPPQQIEVAARLLQSAGYVPVRPDAAREEALHRWHSRRKESEWHSVGGGFHLDLHTRLADHPSLLPELGADSPSQTVAIAPGIELPTLGRDELFAYLCVHGASSAWFRLKWITDFAALLHREGAGEIERLYRASQRLGAGRAAGQALLLAHRLFQIALGKALEGQLSSAAANRLLTGIAERQLSTLREPTEALLGTATIHLSQLLLLPGWGFKLSETARQVRGILGLMP
jgi:hypothetical protein